MRKFLFGFWLALALPAAGAEIKIDFGDAADRPDADQFPRRAGGWRPARRMENRHGRSAAAARAALAAGAGGHAPRRGRANEHRPDGRAVSDADLRRRDVQGFQPHDPVQNRRRHRRANGRRGVPFPKRIEFLRHPRQRAGAQRAFLQGRERHPFRPHRPGNGHCHQHLAHAGRAMPGQSDHLLAGRQTGDADVARQFVRHRQNRFLDEVRRGELFRRHDHHLHAARADGAGRSCRAF